MFGSAFSSHAFHVPSANSLNKNVTVYFAAAGNAAVVLVVALAVAVVIIAIFFFELIFGALNNADERHSCVVTTQIEIINNGEIGIFFLFALSSYLSVYPSLSAC